MVVLNRRRICMPLLFFLAAAYDCTGSSPMAVLSVPKNIDFGRASLRYFFRKKNIDLTMSSRRPSIRSASSSGVITRRRHLLIFCFFEEKYSCTLA